MKRFYLAYGSNMNMKEMRRRCPGAKPLGLLELNDAQLVFRGVADVIYSPGASVTCALWQITADNERSLDAYEGVRDGFYSKEYVELPEHGNAKALIYVMNSDGIYPPSAHYYERCVQGYKDFGADLDCIEAALAHSFDSKAPDQQTVSRRARQRAGNQKQLVKMPESVALNRIEAKRKLMQGDQP